MFRQHNFHQSSGAPGFQTLTWREQDFSTRSGYAQEDCGAGLSRQANLSAGDVPEGAEEADASLEDVARDEREYVRERLREELGRVPTDEEVDDWLQRHTEGY